MVSNDPGDSLRSQRLNPSAGEHEHVRFSLYTVERWKWYGNR
jgi:hypothetical protein